MSGWIDRAPMYLQTQQWHDGEPVQASVDRQWLWRVEAMLAVSANTDALKLLSTDLTRYLNESCGHEWRETEDYDGNRCRQCRWCNNVVWAV